MSKKTEPSPGKKVMKTEPRPAQPKKVVIKTQPLPPDKRIMKTQPSPPETPPGKRDRKREEG